MLQRQGRVVPTGCRLRGGGGRWRRQALLADGKIMKCEYRMPAGNDVQEWPGGGKSMVGWFWPEDSKYNE